MCLSSATDLHLISYGTSSFPSTTPPNLLISSIFLPNQLFHQKHSSPIPPSISQKHAICHSSIPLDSPIPFPHQSHLFHSSHFFLPFSPQLHISPKSAAFPAPSLFPSIIFELSLSLFSPHFLPPSVLAAASFTLALYSEWLHAWLTHSWTPLSVTDAGRMPSRFQCNQLAYAHLTCI